MKEKSIYFLAAAIFAWLVAFLFYGPNFISEDLAKFYNNVGNVIVGLFTILSAIIVYASVEKQLSFNKDNALEKNKRKQKAVICGILTEIEACVTRMIHNKYVDVLNNES